MELNEKVIGKTYGPLTYKAGVEKLKEYAKAVLNDNPHHQDVEFAAKSAHGEIIAVPTFCVNFNMQPFVDAALDPELGVNLLKLVHGEQKYDFHRPVKDDDVLITTGKIENVWAKGAMEFFTVRSETTLESGEPVVTGWYTGVIR